MALDALPSDIAKLVAEDLYKVNEAIFNLPEEDTIDTGMSKTLYVAVTKVHESYCAGRYDKKDQNFFYDYVALLSTMQNQPFFSEKENKQMLKWLLEAVASDSPPEPAQPAAKAAPAPSLAKDIARLEAENAELSRQAEKMRELSDAVVFIQGFKPVLLEAREPAGGGGEGEAAAGEGKKPRKRKKDRKKRGSEEGAPDEEPGEAPEGAPEEEAEASES
ncbi:unnamed protein product [Prorocentrum cordatum]|uniref:Uncharacterized protein n=1 Tax=Prorocentrum cordatum TaxID=2364126 RepID=A0ABN9RJF8_9DINO|nr:unnamed protein product [Polarella glacialis]